MTFGTAGWGTSSWGGGSGAISIARAWATSTRTILVETSSAARAADPFDDGDALNPTTWVVTRLDAMTNLTPIFVQPAGGWTMFAVTVMEELGSAAVQHRIGSTTLLSATGALVTAPYQATFQGVTAATDAVQGVTRRPRVRDLRNPFRGEGRTGDVVSAILTAGGDYQTEVDAAVVRKGLVRRLTTPRGAIRHLPNYGIGFQPKALIPMGGAREALRVEIETQAKQEPGVKAARADVSIYSGGVALIRVRARMVAAQLEVSVRRNSDGNLLEI